MSKEAQAVQSPDQTATRAVDLWRWRSPHGCHREADRVAAEEPLEIRVRGRGIAVTMRSPGDDAELAAGFLLGEGLITRREDVLDIAHCLQSSYDDALNILNVFLAPDVRVDFEQLSRHVFTTSSCGLCGRASIDAVHQQFPAISAPIQVPAELLVQLPLRLRAAQRNFAQTGGLHAAALFTADGELLVIREDVGRHNAVDKCVGFALLNGAVPLEEHILLVSGRASFEIVQKAWAAQIPIVAAISAPSSLAVACAQESGQTLVAFLRGPTMNIYAGAQRIG